MANDYDKRRSLSIGFSERFYDSPRHRRA